MAQNFSRQYRYKSNPQGIDDDSKDEAEYWNLVANEECNHFITCRWKETSDRGVCSGLISFGVWKRVPSAKNDQLDRCWLRVREKLLELEQHQQEPIITVVNLLKTKIKNQRNQLPMAIHGNEVFHVLLARLGPVPKLNQLQPQGVHKDVVCGARESKIEVWRICSETFWREL